MNAIEKRFEWLTSLSIVNYRFVHEILMLMSKVPDKRIPTMGVRVLGAGFELRYNPEFFMSLTDEEAMFIFHHECLHLALHHCTRRNFPDQNLAGIATDLAVNELIDVEKGSCERPTNLDGSIMGLFVDEMKKNPVFKDMLNKQSGDWYYEFLKDKVPPTMKLTLVMRGAGQSGKDGESGEGSGGKNGMDKEPAGGKGQKEQKMDGLDDHGCWDGDNEIADEIVKAKIDEMIRNNSWGSMSAGAIESIKAAQKSQVNWRRHIRRFGGNVVWREQVQTVKRPNRRTGFLHPGFRRVHVDRILVATDNSGSVSSEALGQFLREINRIQETVPVDLLQFDADITYGPKPYDKKRATFDFVGRGGTDFQPVIDMAQQKRYKGLIILTDGCAPAPSKPPATRVLWAMVDKNCNPPVEWGEKVYVKKY